MQSLTAQERAARSAATMLENDSASRVAGIECVSVLPGGSVCQMQVEDRHTNGHRICHGGYIFMLADTAFALACNSYNQSTVAQHNNITFVSPGALGDILTARAVEQNKARRSGIYDVTVVNQAGITIALFRGHSRTIAGQLFYEEV